jgi:hypothetical protein
MIQTRFSLVALCLAMLLPACGGRYVLPIGDGISSYSPPLLEGRLIDVAPLQLTIDVGDRQVVVQIQPTTQFFKIAGGLVFRDELRAGQRVQVWYESRREEREASPRAAVVMVASLDPGDEP